MTDLKFALQQPSQWFILAQDRQQWREVRVAPQSSSTMPKSVHCVVCDRKFSRVSDRTRHKCTTQRRLPIQLQHGSVQCQNCQRWFRSKGGYSVHRCQPVTSSPTPTVTVTGWFVSIILLSVCRSDLGPEVGYEAIGVCDSQLPTVAVWAKATAQDTPAAAAASAQGDNTLRSDTEQEEVSDEKPKKKKKSKKAKKEPVTKELVQDAEKKVDPENYGKGVVFYMREKKVVGILLWNVFHRMPLARRIIADAEDHEDLGELAKKFRLHEE
ncbi:uncharacterized protein LOC135821701 [Sycon ciliatum]|uniref:uncharacterized protein LOC135821701 n=1 Tax=Sycon ciliatum TaxID=27933 RepID=UPI0031F63CB7